MPTGRRELPQARRDAPYGDVLNEEGARRVFAAARHPGDHALPRSWFLSGRLRMRLPVAAKIALSTAGAATAIVGSPTPPQKPPDGIAFVSTAGISSMRITL